MNYVTYRKTTGDLISYTNNQPTETPDFGFAEAPPELRFEEIEKWKYDLALHTVCMRSGSDLEIVEERFKERTKWSLILKYFAALMNPVTQGAVEGVIDVLMDACYKVAKGQAFTQQELDNLDMMFNTVHPTMKYHLATLTQEDVDSMRDLKQEARTAEVAMYNDPMWPREE
jgi:hypothetical protein